MSSSTSGKNYDLAQNAPWGKNVEMGCVNTPFYGYNADNNVPTKDNRSYSLYATPEGYRGYYDQQCLMTKNSYMPCDLRYVFAKPSTVNKCWDKCDTRNCHVNCVIGSQ